MNSKFYKGITVVLLILGAVGGIALGAVFQSVHTNFLTDTVTRSFNFTLMLVCWVSTVLLCLIFGGIAKILAYLEELGAGKSSVIAITTDWECPKCHCMNKAEATECSNCHLEHTDSRQAKFVSNDKWECPQCHCINSYNDIAECPNCHWRP